MYPLDDNLSLLKETEELISLKAKTLSNYRYAFSIILPENIYKTLVDLYQKTNYYDLPDEFPWCHLKLLTETFVRVYRVTEHEYSLENLLSISLNVKEISYWGQIPKLIKSLKLKQIREKGGPWHIYANLILHSGVPVAYFPEIYDIVDKEFKSFNKNIPLTTNKLCDDEDVFKYRHFSKYFKEAFRAPIEKKILFTWFCNLVYIAYFKKDLIQELKTIIPPHLVGCLHEIIQRDSTKNKYSYKQFFRKASDISQLRFNPDKGNLEYIISLDESNFANSCINIRADFEFPKNWNKEIEKAYKTRALNLTLPITPSSLSWILFLGKKRIKIFDIPAKNPVKIIIFDSDYNLIDPNKKEIIFDNIKKAHLTIITKVEDVDLKEKVGWYQVDDLSGDWWTWYHYEWELNTLDKPVIMKFPEPYGEIKISTKYDSNDISGEWISDSKLYSNGFIKQFGGKIPPKFILRSGFLNSENRPLISARFIHGSCIIQDSGRLNFQNNQWIWESNLALPNFSDLIYEIHLEIFNMTIDCSKFAEFYCVWFPSLEIEISPHHIIWPDDKCTITLRANSRLQINQNLFTDITEDPFTKYENGIRWIYLKRPPDCMPLVILKEKQYVYEFYIKLPYFMVWIQTEIDNIESDKIMWTNSKPFDRSFLEDLLQKDYKARIKFRILTDEKKVLYLFDRNNTIIKKISFEQNGNDSISCATIIKYNEPIIRDIETKSEALLFRSDNKDKIIWNFERIHNNIKQQFLFEDKYFNPHIGGK